jgi:hypothetical protein
MDQRFTAYAKENWMRQGVDIGLREGNLVWDFGEPVLTRVTEASGVVSPPLTIPLDAARALYEALGEMFGYATHNAQSIRQDFLHERKRVDKMIDHLLKD